MKKRLVLSLLLLLFLTTITLNQKIIITKFNIKEINIENNILLSSEEVKKLLIPIYETNLFFLKYEEVEKALMKSSLVGSFEIRKKYPNSLEIKIFEKTPIAIIFHKKKKYFLSENIELIKFEELKYNKSLPFVLGKRDKFESFYNRLKINNFPVDIIKKYTFFETNRWDIETYDNKIIKLPPVNYINSLEKYLSLKNDSSVRKYKVFDFRIEKQLILK
mgnify:CR=1 FL=1